MQTRGIKPVFWGDALREGEFTYWIYEGLFGVSDIPQQNDIPTPTDTKTPDIQSETNESNIEIKNKINSENSEVAS